MIKVTGLEDVHMLYIDDEGDAVALSSKGMTSHDDSASCDYIPYMASCDYAISL